MMVQPSITKASWTSGRRLYPIPRRRKLTRARELRKQENIKLRQRLIPFPKDRTITCSKKQSVSFGVKQISK